MLVEQRKQWSSWKNRGHNMVKSLSFGSISQVHDMYPFLGKESSFKYKIFLWSTDWLLHCIIFPGQITLLEDAGYLQTEIFNAMKKNKILPQKSCDLSKIWYTIVNGKYIICLNTYSLGYIFVLYTGCVKTISTSFPLI